MTCSGEVFKPRGQRSKPEIWRQRIKSPTEQNQAARSLSKQTLPERTGSSLLGFKEKHNTRP